MKTMLKLVMIALAGMAGTASANNLTGMANSKYYRVHPLFHPFPEEDKTLQSIDRFGPVGVGINLVQPAFQMQVKNVEPGSPAAATGKLKPGQIIDSINGRVLKDMDPRQILGDIIAQAEATDGVVKFVVREKAGAPAEEVIVNIPVLGAYSATWPVRCAKSDAIVRNLAAFVAQNGSGNMGLGALFLLSTGEEQDLEVVRGWMQKIAAENKDKTEMTPATWYVGYQGLAFCEYYLRSGDPAILHTIKLYADYMQKTQINGAWGHKGFGSFSYSASGHLNAAGAHVLTFLLLARECGVAVDETMLQSALKYFYKFAGHGNVAYGDSLPEKSFVDNGKTGILAFGMQAAATLTPEGENSVYAKARDISASKSFYSTSWMLHGHTGGGIGEIWRGAAMGLVREKQPKKYREFMNERAWFYDLSRRYDGSFGIIGGGRYDEPKDWGIGMGLVYTLPRKTLRLTGAPPSKFCKTHPLPKRPWGTAADEVFFALEAAPVRGGKPHDANNETLVNDGSWPVLRKLAVPDVTDETLLKYAHHPELGIREYAVNQIRAKNRADLTVELLKSSDPRVRHAGILGISEVTDEMAGLLLGMVNDPNESWWVARGALEKLETARAELLAPHKDRLLYWLKHEDWWMSSAALSAVSSLVADKEHAETFLPVIGEMITKNVRQSPIWQLEKMLRNASPEVQASALQVLARAYAQFPKTVTTAAGVKVDTAEPQQVGAYAWLMAKLPTGYDVLYELSKSRYPGQTLPHPKLFLEANPERFGPELRNGFQRIIREQLIPEFIGQANHIASNRKLLLEECSSAVPFKSNLYYGLPRVEDLADFHRRLGVRDYDWHEFGPAFHTMKFDYFTFDPPEQLQLGTRNRYRKVTFPPGMDNWFATDFDPRKAGWSSGLQPFGQMNGKLVPPAQTFWDKEVLLARGTFTFPKFKESCRYRLGVGVWQTHQGEGYRVYVNGKLMMERDRGVLPRERGESYYYIDKAWWPDFQNGNTVIAFTSFLQMDGNGKRNNFRVWLEEMKCPPIGETEILESVKAVPMRSAAWQALQDPDNMELDPAAGLYRWDGKFAPNAKVVGTWAQLGEVAAVEAFTPAARLRPNSVLPAKLTFAENGRTDDPLLYYTGDVLLHLNTNQALQMKVVNDHLFIEAGGFETKKGANWKCPWLVFKRVQP